MNIFEYITATLDKGSIGAYISVGLIALVAVCALLGVMFGARRGFSKSVIRIFTVAASAGCSLFGVRWICQYIVNSSDKVTADGAKSVADVLEHYSPGLINSFPDMVRPIVEEVDAGNATIFIMMILALIVSPLIFIAVFQILKAISFLLYSLLAGLTGAISYGKGHVSTVLGAAVGLVQGLIIAAVMIFPISGLCHVAMDVREPLIGNTDEPNEYITKGYTTVIDDLADNPLFNIVDKLGGQAFYEDMITFKIQGEKVYMGDKCIGAIKVIADGLPLTESSFNWKNPSQEDRHTLSKLVTDIGGDELVAGLTSDIARGAAKAVQTGKIDFPVSGGAIDALINDVMTMFSTSTKDTIEGDLDTSIDVYFIMCDRGLMDSFSIGVHNDMRTLLTQKGADGKTAASVIIDRLNEYDRAVPIVTSFTKISLSVMHGSENFGPEADVLYENVKGGVAEALTHNRSDFETEEEYKEAVKNDLDKTLAENNINVDESVRANMVEYIATNYGDYDGEIGEREVNDALLSYYESYASASQAPQPEPEPAVPDTNEGTDE